MYEFLFASLVSEGYPNEVTLKGKNLLQREQILFFKS